MTSQIFRISILLCSLLTVSSLASTNITTHVIEDDSDNDGTVDFRASSLLHGTNKVLQIVQRKETTSIISEGNGYRVTLIDLDGDGAFESIELSQTTGLILDVLKRDATSGKYTQTPQKDINDLNRTKTAILEMIPKKGAKKQKKDAR